MPQHQNLNLTTIESGMAFQSLVSALIQHDGDPEAFPFSRPGPDMGQDVLSSNREIVYQAKFHKNESASLVISDAKREFKSIQTYKNESGPKQTVWQSVKQWILVTNASFNTHDRQIWECEIVPLFAQLGLDAKYWEKETVKSKLVNHPELVRAYFGGETRVLLSPAEAIQKESKLNFFVDTLQIPYAGREESFVQVNQFLEQPNKTVLVVHGPGGIGKGRFLLECMNRIVEQNPLTKNKKWQVYWALVEDMDKSSNWYEGMVPEKDTLVFVDEPPSESLLKRLIGQSSFANSRSSQWKFIVAARSSNDPVLHYLNSPGVKGLVQELALEALSDASSIQMCQNLLEYIQFPDELISEAATKISSKFQGFPVWMAIAIQLLKENNDLTQLPNSVGVLAKSYLDEITNNQRQFESDKILETLRWLALVREVNSENNGDLEYLANQAKLQSTSELKRIMSHLVQRGVLFQDGIRNRLYRIKPDVFQEHILMEWLTFPFNSKREPHEHLNVILQDIYDGFKQGYTSIDHLQRMILHNILFLDFTLKQMNEPVRLLRDFLFGIRRTVADWPVQSQSSLFNYLPILGILYASEVLDICESALNSETSRTKDEQARILSAVVHCVDENAKYVEHVEEQEQCLNILLKIIDLKSALSLDFRNEETISRLLTGRSSYRSNFSEVCFQRGKTFLTNLLNQSALEPADKLWLEYLIKPQLRVERHSTYAETRDHFIIYKLTVEPNSKEWNFRKDLLGILVQILKKNHFVFEEKILFWQLLDQSLGELSFCRSKLKDNLKLYEIAYDSLKSELSEVYQLIQTNIMTLEELIAARKIWDWFCRYEKDEVIKSVAIACENWFQQQIPYAAEYDDLVDWLTQPYEQTERKSHEKGHQLALSAPETIKQFVEQGVTYLGGSQSISRLSSVAYGIGLFADESTSVWDYLKDALIQEPQNPHFQFAGNICRSWMSKHRKEHPGISTLKLFQSFLALVPTLESKIILTDYVYESSWIFDVSPDEFDYLLTVQDNFKAVNKLVPYLQIIGGMALVDLVKFQSCSEQILASLPLSEKEKGLSALIESLYYAVQRSFEKNKSENPNNDLVFWVLNQVIQLPDLDHLGANWHLEEFLKLLKKPDITWLYEAIKKRIVLAQQNNEYEILPFSNFLTTCMTKPSEQDFQQTAIRQAVSHLIDLLWQEPCLLFRLPKCLVEIDPNGLLVPDTIVKVLIEHDKAHDFDFISYMAQVAGYYHMNEVAWRKIAHQVCVNIRDQEFKERDKRHVMLQLQNPDPGFWICTPGKVPDKFIQAVKTAEEDLAKETDSILIPFRKWVLDSAKKELAYHTEQVKEPFWYAS